MGNGSREGEKRKRNGMGNGDEMKEDGDGKDGE